VAEGERVVLRLLDRDSSVLSMEQLGMRDTTEQLFGSLLGPIARARARVRPTGSGKTTTLYAALRGVDTARKNVMTIEDPIEYQLPDIGQIQVKPKIGLTCARGLRHILRQDPDVILVGETRDVETAEIAVRASLTGHLVFTTLHTNDAPSAAIRMLDMGVESYLLAAALRAVLSQRLVRRLCPKCRVERLASAAEMSSLGNAGQRLQGQPLWAAKGCAACLDGYRGRMGLYELMLVDAQIEEIIRTGQGSASRLRGILLERGIPALVDDGVDKILSGETTVDEVSQAVGQFSRLTVSMARFARGIHETFQYKGLDREGYTRKGLVEALDAKDAGKSCPGKASWPSVFPPWARRRADGSRGAGRCSMSISGRSCTANSAPF